MSLSLLGFICLILGCIFGGILFLFARGGDNSGTQETRFQYAADHARRLTVHIEIPTGMYLLLFENTDAASFGAVPGIPDRVYIVKSIHDVALALRTGKDDDDVFVLDSDRNLLLDNWVEGGQWFGHEARLPWLKSNRLWPEHVDGGYAVENVIFERAVSKMQL